MVQQVVLADKADKSGIDEEIKITFRTTKGLLRELKHHAADNDMTVTDILNQACRDFLSKKAHK
jgi:hypothetical protein